MTNRIPARRLPCQRQAAIWIGVLLCACCGCTGNDDPAVDPLEVESGGSDFSEDLRTIRVTSPAFGEGDVIPTLYTCEGDNLSPPLEWGGIPEAANAVVILCEDPDAPGGTFVHWVCYAQQLSERSLPEDVQGQSEGHAVWMMGENDFATMGYRGPCPPAGPPHRYRFRVITAESDLNIAEGASIDEVLLEIESNILAWGELTATFGTGGVE